MHMLSRRDINSAELEIVRVSKSPTTVVAANGRSTNKKESDSVIGFIRDSKASRLYTGCSLTRKTLPRSRIFQRVEHWPETTTHQRWQTDKMQHGELRADRGPWFMDRLFTLSNTCISDISTAGSHLSHEPPETKNTNKNGDNETVRGNPLRDLPEWLEEFTENLVDERVPVHWDAPASSSRESVSEPRVKVASGKHSIYTHFPKDRNCDICMRTKITRAPCRKRTGTAIHRAENVGDLMTADHKVLRKGCVVHRKELAKVLGSLTIP